MVYRKIRIRKSRHGSSEHAISNEENDTRSQEKLLVLINKWPVPKPTQVVKASSLR